MRIHRLLLSALLALCATTAHAECEGNACNDVTFSFQSGCYVTTNTGSRAVKVERGPYSFELKPKQTHRLVIGNSCPSAYMGGDKAYYTDVKKGADEASCRPPSALPNGSYKNSCSSCRIENCNYLICSCDRKNASADLRQCPQNNYCNRGGQLVCGEC